jgi:hypothetical protein
MTEPERAAGALPRSRRFPTTRWSVVRAAGGTASPEARAALESLCVIGIAGNEIRAVEVQFRKR